ncbi:MAG: resuscitation-promoting factor RpfA, partial [Actinomycetota bacterium]|nr:resuscitation-promoting factor RpfA [Actinomycetota bacterium]
MRTQRRPLAVAATIATALFGVALVAGASPAAAAAPSTTAAVTDCGTTSVRADGMLDADLLQACLDDVQASLSFQPSNAAPADDAAVGEEAVVAPAALDAMFSVVEPEPAAVEVAPVDNGPGGDFAALADCESGGDYSINTGNGYYGAYQFSLSTWQSLGYEGYPHEAS